LDDIHRWRQIFAEDFISYAQPSGRWAPRENMKYAYSTSTGAQTAGVAVCGKYDTRILAGETPSPIPVEGKNQTFTLYTAGAAVVAVASIGDVDVMIRCPRSIGSRGSLLNPSIQQS
jgi:hypothetical protein